MAVEYEVLSVNPTTGSLCVKYFSEEIPDGFTFNVDIPLVNDEFVGQEELEKFLKAMTPTSQFDRIAKLSKGVSNADSIKTIFPNAAVIGDVNNTTQQTVDKAEQARLIRTNLLYASDYVMIPDFPLTDVERAAWMEYRQSLRDITNQLGFPDNISWPMRPDEEPR